ncbi:hypothetical protein ACQEVY_21595 [Streptomyces sp. CA-288835]|uniref:hypothetical protein n=1 Tax=Streptomyces sp. CA-288835 TaxID=3240069 RepID=UPI003D94F285
MNERAREPRGKELQRIALRRLFAGTALAIAGTAAMVAVTLPMEASGDGGFPEPGGAAAPHTLTTPAPSPNASPSTTDTGTGTGEVVRPDSAPGVHPAPTDQESREALKVLLASPLGNVVRLDFQAATGRPLAAPAQLRVRGLVYEGSGSAELADCDGAHRCVRLLTRVVGGPWIDTRRFVIDLSARTAHRLP